MSKLQEALEKIEDEEVRNALQAAHDEDVSGLKAHQATLMDEAKQAKRAKQEFEGKAKKFDALHGVVGDRDLERLGQILGDYDNGKLVQAGQEGDAEEMRRRLREQWDVETKSKYQPVIEERDTLAQERDALRQSLESERIDNRAITAAHKHGIDENGMEIVSMLARRDWQLEDDGNPVTRDADGNIRVGKGGAMTFDEWVDGPLREKYPMLFPKPVGGGAPGNPGGRATRKWSDYSEAERAQLARDKPDEFKRLQATKGE